MPNPAISAPIPISVFGSWVTEMSPDALPDGVSPDNQDLVFVPGSASSRPALQRVFAAPFPAGGPGNLVPGVVWGKSFRTPVGTRYNLYFDTNGIMWYENRSATPGSYTQLFSATPGSFCRSLTANGREYITISDGLHGSFPPLQWDGTNIDRVSQDGPGTAPAVQSVAFAAVNLAASSGGSSAITSIVTSGYTGFFYTTLTIIVASTAGFAANQGVTVSGNSQASFNSTYIVTQILNSTTLIVSVLSGNSLLTGTGGTLSTTGVTLSRAGNIVTATTATAHNLQQGYQALIQGVPDQSVATISSIVLKNESNPGIATVTTAAAHGLVPNNQVGMTGISGAAVGTAITNVAREAQVATITMTIAHGLQVGSYVKVACSVAGNVSFNGLWYVSAVPSSTTFSYAQVDSDFASASDAGSVTYIWPIASAVQGTNFYTVLETPTATTFTIAFNYTDGTWTGGTVSLPWNGTFYVTAVLSSTSFQYQQYGPTTTTTQVGTVTPWGQMAPGIHLCRCSFLTRQGAVTRPGPWTQFEASGGQYPSVTQIPLGPSYVIARILEFTGAGGNYFFYLPVAPQVSGQVVGTATQINDNATTAAIFDFGDPSLFTGIGTNTSTYNTLGQVVLDGALGFLTHKQRLHAFGMRNTVNNLLNMGFGGGFQPGSNVLPGGWTYPGTTGLGQLVTKVNPAGLAWAITPDGSANKSGELTQPAYQDQTGAPILVGNTQYTFRCRVDIAALSGAANGQFVAALISPTQGTLATATMALPVVPLGQNQQAYFQANFSAKTPNAIPPDTYLAIWSQNAVSLNVITVDELQLIYQQTPYLDTVLLGSYITNFEGFNGTTGVYGPPDDTHKVMDGGVIRNTLYLLTQDPEGRLHEVITGNTEPSGWDVEEIDSVCGAMSAFSLTKSQADNRSASGGEEWFAWASQSGARIFGGGVSHKISQEIQPAWWDPANVGTWSQINMAASTSVFAMNDPTSKTIYFGLPLGTATAPNLIYTVSYRGMDSAEMIAAAAPVRTSFSGRLLATDNTRKWTRWNAAVNGIALMDMGAAGVANPALNVVLFSGNGQTFGAAASFGNVYTLNPAKYTDDDYGQLNPYYVTAAIPNATQEEQYQLGAGRKILDWLAATISGVGQVTITPLVFSLTNPWAQTCTRVLSLTPTFDLTWGGGGVQGERVFFKIASSPLATQTDNGFTLKKFIPWFRKNVRTPVRGSAQ